MNSLHSNPTVNPRKQDTFLIPSTTSSGIRKKHLHIAITEPVDSGNRMPCILLVSLASIRQGESGYDETCILQPADHPFIKHASYVVYRQAVIMELRDLHRNLKNGIIKPKERAGVDVVARIVMGVEKSPSTKNYIVDFLRRANGVI